MGLVPVRKPLLGDQGRKDRIAPRDEGRQQPPWPRLRFAPSRWWGRGLSGGVSPEGTAPGFVRGLGHGVSTSLHPFAPPALPGFGATTGRSDSYPAALRILIRDNEPRWDPGRSLCFMCSAVRPSRLQPPNLPRDRFDTLPLSVAGFRVIPVRASPFPSRLAARSGRIEFTFVTGWSFTSGCFPPPLARTQLPSVTGRRARA